MKAVICGAGIAGLALAQRLDTLGWDVVVLERAHGPRTQGYMIDFFGPGYDVAEAMGVLPRLRELGYQVGDARYLDETGRRRAGLNYAQFAKVVQGRLLSIMRPDLERALRERLPGGVDLRFATSLTHVDNRADGVHLTLTDGSTLDADLLVGADGIHSTVRSLVFGEERQYFRYLGFHTAAFIFGDPEIHSEVRGRFCLTDTTGRQMGLNGLRDGQVAAFTVHRTPDPTLPSDAQVALRQEYGSLGWVVPRALAHCPPAARVRPVYRRRADRQVGGGRGGTQRDPSSAARSWGKHRAWTPHRYCVRSPFSLSGSVSRPTGFARSGARPRSSTDWTCRSWDNGRARAR